MSTASTLPGRRTGALLSGVVVVFLSFDAVIHLLDISEVKSSMTELGYPTHLSPVIGAIELACVALYAVRRTAPLGAVLLTGFLGGAIATNLRVDKPLISTTLFPVYVATAMWLGLALRDDEVRRIVRRVVRVDTLDPGDIRDGALPTSGRGQTSR